MEKEYEYVNFTDQVKQELHFRKTIIAAPYMQWNGVAPTARNENIQMYADFASLTAKMSCILSYFSFVENYF